MFYTQKGKSCVQGIQVRWEITESGRTCETRSCRNGEKLGKQRWKAVYLGGHDVICEYKLWFAICQKKNSQRVEGKTD